MFTSKEVTLFSIISLAYLIGQVIPIECTLAVFCSMLFYYFIGLKAIGFFYLLLSIDAIRSFPYIFSLCSNLLNSLPSILSQINTTEENTIPNYPIWVWVISLYVLAYIGTLVNFLIARSLIKKLKLRERFGVLKL